MSESSYDDKDKDSDFVPSSELDNDEEVAKTVRTRKSAVASKEEGEFFIIKSISHDVVSMDESFLIGDMYATYKHGRNGFEVLGKNNLFDEQKYEEHVETQIKQMAYDFEKIYGRMMINIYTRNVMSCSTTRQLLISIR